MDELNNAETMPTVDELVLEDPIVEVDAVEPVIDDAPAETPELTHIDAREELAVEAPVTKKSIKDENLVALYSDKDFSGISKGYSKVDKIVAQGMLKNKHIRLATEEEITIHLNN